MGQKWISTHSTASRRESVESEWTVQYTNRIIQFLNIQNHPLIDVKLHSLIQENAKKSSKVIKFIDKIFFIFAYIYYKKSSSNIQYLKLVPCLSADSPPQQLRDPFQNGCCNRSGQFSLWKSNKQTVKAMAKYNPTET